MMDNDFFKNFKTTLYKYSITGVTTFFIIEIAE